MIGGDAMRFLLLSSLAWAAVGWSAPGHAQVHSGPLRKPAASAYDVVALRVEFQPDTTRFSTGDGTFAGDPYQGIEPLIDPLPHDAAYFEAHLAFLEDYVARVSDGETVVRTHLVPGAVQLPRSIGAYAPTGLDADSDAERAKLARLVHDAWTFAEADIDFDMSGFTPGRTALLLFHAGVGRDTELSSTSLDRTPEDLPSIFFDAESLNRLGAGGATFHGFPVDHSMIVPRTETRPGTDPFSGERYLLELSINGLLAASFFNFLGVPDLFDTESGQSAIGPFGLMDAQGIFAYSGLLPPEPMAWTKYFLGWTDPVDITGDGPQTVRLRAVSLPDASESARVLVSDAEYFLVENRYRDPEGDGLTLRVLKEGHIVEQHVNNGDSLFNSVTTTGFVGGVVVGADGYDWALPGGVDSEDSEIELNGGVLIWHVDERRLRAGLADHAVNVGEERAIDLEEADGPQDIGYPSRGLFGNRRYLGAPYDFFYEGNPFAPPNGLYRNRFGPDTYPGSETNAGGPSFVVLDAFSPPGADMSFVYQRETVGGAAPVDAPELRALHGALMSLPAGSKVSKTEDHLLIYGLDSVAVATRGLAAPAGRVPTAASPAVAPGNRMATFECRMDGGDERCAIVVRDLGEPFDAPEAVWELPPEAGAGRPISPIVHVPAESGDTWHVLLDGETGGVHVQASASGVRVVPGKSGGAVALAAWHGPAGRAAPVVFESGGVEIDGTAWNYTVDPASGIGSPAVGRERAGSMAVLPLTGTGGMLLLAPGGVTRRIDVRAVAASTGRAGKGVLSDYPVLVDVDGDDRLDVLAAMDSTIFAFTQSGALAAGFPVTLPARIVAQPLVFRFEGAEGWTVLAAATDGYLYAVGAGGQAAAPFPLEAGDAVHTTPLLLGDRIIAISTTGFAKAWRIPPISEIWWGELYGSGAQNSFTALEERADPLVPEGLIDSKETYNWPNPIDGDITHLRIRTSRDAQVRVTILDAGGAQVGDVDMGSIVGGIPTETVWQANVQSGLYFARFTAKATDGTRATKLIKMAVIR